MNGKFALLQSYLDDDVSSANNFECSVYYLHPLFQNKPIPCYGSRDSLCSELSRSVVRNWFILDEEGFDGMPFSNHGGVSIALQMNESFFTVSWACDIDGNPLLVAAGSTGIIRVINCATEKIYKV